MQYRKDWIYSGIVKVILRTTGTGVPRGRPRPYIKPNFVHQMARGSLHRISNVRCSGLPRVDYRRYKLNLCLAFTIHQTVSAQSRRSVEHTPLQGLYLLELWRPKMQTWTQFETIKCTLGLLMRKERCYERCLAHEIAMCEPVSTGIVHRLWVLCSIVDRPASVSLWWWTTAKLLCLILSALQIIKRILWRRWNQFTIVHLW